MTEFFFATGNDYKIEEAKAAVLQFNIGITKFDTVKKLEIQNLDLEEIANTAVSLIISQSKKPIFVEDSGLFIHHLNGFPGPYSSFVFETIGVDGILKLMEEAKTRKAEFRSSVAFGMNGKWLATFSSATEGTIQLKPRGTNGFGFDPIFVPMWTSKTFSEMELKEKTVYSHRAKAISKLALWFLNEATKKNPDLTETDSEGIS
ncbi:MAG: RdgB/HAM1 family non-canonical purine NTP pyrophosphatase [Thaumarchaeota archaeon]|nr:RdgB/HAM1 family non-canonical purine NTP pyrophosphatase [Nitrososphaerota archaeon]